MKDSRKIDELLNCYIDGELGPRHQVELQRLIRHDPEVAKRLRWLQKCKLLVGSLPPGEAPPEMLQRIKAAVETRRIIAQQPAAITQRAGAWHLLARRLVNVAAMVALIAVLAAVVYTVVRTNPAPPAAPPIAANTTAPATTPAASRSQPFYGTLELKTADFAAIDTSIHRALADHGVSASFVSEPQARRNIYTVTCSPAELELVLADLAGIWNRLDSATLAVETDRFGHRVIVDNVLPEQLLRIVDEPTHDQRLRSAQAFAAANKIQQLMPGKEVYALVEPDTHDLPGLFKPLMTGGTPQAQRSPQPASGNQVNITIVLRQ